MEQAGRRWGPAVSVHAVIEVTGNSAGRHIPQADDKNPRLDQARPQGMIDASRGRERKRKGSDGGHADGALKRSAQSQRLLKR